MKKILTFAAIAAISFSAFTGCKKSSSSSSYFVKATVNGTPLSLNYGYGIVNSGIVDIFGFNGSGTSVTFPEITLVSTNSAAGTYTIDGMTVMAAIDSSATSAIGAAYGTLTITTSTASVMTGTFSFTCTDSTKVTNGSFTVKVN